MKNDFKASISNTAIAIVTTTFYPFWYRETLKNNSTEQVKIDKIRGDLAIEMLSEAKKKNFQIILIDAGSSRVFTKEIARIGIKIIRPKNKALSPSRQYGFILASKMKGVKVICWLEPEKVSIPKDCLPQAVLPILNNQADIVIPKRDKKAFSTYPSFQARIEKIANKKWNSRLKEHKLLSKKAEELDIWFGPKFFKNDPKLINIFQKSYQFKDKIQKLDIWSNAIIFPIITALKLGYKVVSSKVQYEHPKQQTVAEENSVLMRRKRQIQYQSILSTTEHFIKNFLVIKIVIASMFFNLDLTHLVIL